MKKSFLLVLLCMLASVLPAQKKMYVWQGETPTEFEVLTVDSVTFADAEPTPVPTEPVFSVSATKQVQFSTGNLQYTQSTQTWSFAAQQYESIGKANFVEGEEADKIDLFSWSGTTGSNQWGIGISGSPSNNSGYFADWGQNIGDGTTWRTLTKDEWTYLFNTRTNASTLMGVARIHLNADGSDYANGLILLPDNWTAPADVTFKSGFSSTSSAQAYADYQTLTLDQWGKLEEAGAAFLPASGRRNTTGLVLNYMGAGFYWSATYYSYDWAYYISLDSESTTTNYEKRNYAYAVRLVKDVK